MAKRDSKTPADDYRGKLREQHVKHQKVLIDFLNTDLDLGLTLVVHRPNIEAALKVVRAIRRFKDRVEDIQARREIERRLADLESRIAAIG